MAMLEVQAMTRSRSGNMLRSAVNPDVAPSVAVIEKKVIKMNGWKGMGLVKMKRTKEGKEKRPPALTVAVEVLTLE